MIAVESIQATIQGCRVDIGIAIRPLSERTPEEQANFPKKQIVRRALLNALDLVTREEEGRKEDAV